MIPLVDYENYSSTYRAMLVGRPHCRLLTATRLSLADLELMLNETDRLLNLSTVVGAIYTWHLLPGKQYTTARKHRRTGLYDNKPGH